MRRDSNDKEWKEVKRVVKERDGEVCRLMKVLNMTEALVLSKKAGSYIHTLDPAHYIPVSEDSSIMYDPNNIVMLNHYSHSNLDNSRDPIYGKFISKEEVQKWWERILKGNKSQWEYLKDKGLV